MPNIASTKLWILTAALAIGAAARPTFASRPQDQAGQYKPADIRYGAQVYAAECAICHGPDGDAIAGTNFRAGRFQRVSSDGDLYGTIFRGIPGTAMPPFTLDDAEAVGVVAYIRSMADFDARAAAAGNPARGQQLYQTAGCGACHRLNGTGPRTAPDLTDVGALRTADYLERTLLDPAGAMLPANRKVRAVTKSGQTFTGRRLNEDTYSVQLLDEHERLVSLAKSDLREYTVIAATSMPAYQDKFSSQQLADLVAYLLSLKGLK